MNLTIIGKYGPYPKPGGGTSGYLVQSARTAIALDFGTGTLSGLLNYLNPGDLDAIVLSHLHYDHFSDILPFAYYAQLNSVRPKVILPSGPKLVSELISSAGVFDTVCAADGLCLEIGGLKLSFCAMTHPAESYAVRMTDGKSTLVYSGDTSWNDRIIPFCKSADTVLLDCGNLYEKPGIAHLSMSEAARIAIETGARVIATHLYPEGEYVSNHPNIVIAEEGKKYKV